VNAPTYRLIGQLFDTYWLIEANDKFYLMDQHAAHERVLYEKTLRAMKERTYTSQAIAPPLVVTLTMRELQVLEQYLEHFTRIGFELEPFGEGAYAIRAVPANLFGLAKKELFLELLDQFADGIQKQVALDMLEEKIASLSCKAAVKGKQTLSTIEVDALIADLFQLENPYHCPHGRPTMISMTRKEIEKKFKRII
jgi:DNA mismatch repair protein MutL